ncbi:hypothetical protein COY05_00615 [Candidatus Peregrinibacteria bacterium CG_4_10_14_0_2_um_filter_38_24]|nr:MAG: hypothetical protein COY05_00615 [Candidatus Peregrinibacteria bacterium CG_4_10_14_0_2_um_filter_38_24]PJC39156.1 MAG: hypothetical protein CO044_01260 [Candidatus Peregrinibacteria bacterium CG_4_9_14_0_2_um_filter_38_9]
MGNFRTPEFTIERGKKRPDTSQTRGISLKIKFAALAALAGIVFLHPEKANASEQNIAIGELGLKADQFHFPNGLSQNGEYFLKATKEGNNENFNPYTTQEVSLHAEHFSAEIGAKIPLTPDHFSERLGGHLTLKHHEKHLAAHSSSVIDSEQWRSEASAAATKDLDGHASINLTYR